MATQPIVRNLELKIEESLPTAKRTGKKISFKKKIAIVGTLLSGLAYGTLDGYLGSQREREITHARAALTFKENGLTLYKAGTSFGKNFARDGLISAILAEDQKMLEDQLRFCTLHQGKERNPKTGEEPGKIFHEYPGVFLNGNSVSTEYAACDTTALFLRGHEMLQKLTGDKKFLEESKESIQQAVGYILSHIDERGLFVEDPSLFWAKNLGLGLSYWKDSLLPTDRPTTFPIVYTLAHIQNIAGLRAAAKLLGTPNLEEKAEEMVASLNRYLWDENKGTWYIALDTQGPIDGISSDALQGLTYLEPGDITKERLNVIVESSKVLETYGGFRCLDRETSKKVHWDKYHTSSVWPFVQAEISKGAKRFGLSHVENVSSRIREFILDSNTEVFYLSQKPETYERFNLINTSDSQQWTIAAKVWFEKNNPPGPLTYAKHFLRGQTEDIEDFTILMRKYGFLKNIWPYNKN